MRAKLWREINSAGLGGLINRRLLLIVLRRRCKKPPRRSAAALNQFHGPFITGEIKPIFSFQFFTIIGPLLSHLSGCALAGDKDTSVYELWRPAALRGAVLSSSPLQPVAQTIPTPPPHPPSSSVHREKGERLDPSSRERDRDQRRLSNIFPNIRTGLVSTQRPTVQETIPVYSLAANPRVYTVKA